MVLRLALLAVACFALPGQGAAPPAVRGDDLFRQAVWPALKEKCLACHGDDARKLRGGLDLRTRESALRGGNSGQPALVPGRPGDSLLYLAVSRADPALAMPPKENDRLDQPRIEAVRRWIAAGAPWPSKAAKPVKSAGVTILTSGGRSAEWDGRRYDPADVWAYQPLRRVEPPDPDAHPIDAFLRAKQREKGVVRAAPPADRTTLLRRVTFDLLGLPPAAAPDAARLDDDSPTAYRALVDRLLASPHYGEQWARHWLDVARYADTAGFANDFERPHAWRYRDWVVRALNADKPYDRFIKEQIAGDELAPDDPEMLLAVGFLRMGPWEHTGMSVAAVTRQQYLDDITHSVGVTFLAQGLRCASCHDHKFDPVPTKDYYRLQAVFAPVQFAERKLPFLPAENVRGFDEARAAAQRRIARLEEEQARLRRKTGDAIAVHLKKLGVKRLADLPLGQRPLRNSFGLTRGELSEVKVNEKRLQFFQRELLRYQPLAFSVYSGPDRLYVSNRLSHPVPADRRGAPPVVRILPGGSLAAPAEAVTPGVLSALPDSSRPTAWNTIPRSLGGRRLALANWIASPNNPLTAQTIVNRVWQHHFGKGLVATPGNFGKMGARPTHPELLDWLAVWFVEHGWSLKKLHRLILTSDAYRQAGRHPDHGEIDKLDPKNELLSYFPPRRLAAEELRDAMLAVSGELNLERGGPGVFPEINWEVALQPRHVMGSVAPAYVPSPTPAQRNRRTIYAFRHRTLADPLLEVFNRPGSETACDCRDQATVAPQALALFNSEFAHARALAFAAMLTKKRDTVDERIVLAFRRCHGRRPTADELRRCRAHVDRMTAHHEANPPKRLDLPAKVKRKLVEEMTGEEYEWEEELDLHGYQRDLQPWQADAATRGLAELCLVLFNSNEFVHVR